MTWVRIDDRALAHPKLLKVGPDGVCLWLAGLCYANAHSTNGLVPKVALPLLYASVDWSVARATKAAAKLVAARLWYDEEESWRIHDYDHYQDEALKDRAEERKERDRIRKAEKRAATKAASNVSADVSADMSADTARTNRRRVGGQSADTSADNQPDNARTSPQEVLAPAQPHARAAAPTHARGRGRDPGPSRPVLPFETVCSDRAGAPDLPTPEAHATPLDDERVVALDSKARTAAVAYTRAVEARGGIFQSHANWRAAFIGVHALAERTSQRDGRRVADVLAAWATAYATERQRLRPDWWHEWATQQAAGVSAPKPRRRTGALDAIDNPTGFEQGPLRVKAQSK